MATRTSWARISRSINALISSGVNLGPQRK
jgi:hypothetical protein